MLNNFEEFMKKNTKPTDECYYYKDYNDKIRKSLKNVYRACWRFGLYTSQTIFIMNEMLQPLNKEKSLYEMLGV